ncbi:MAG: hypothetical protein GXP47_14110 [Acidobacteria bacterium]|nr:hypothetical protein [Acidobacteriota bacterium]
MVRGSKRADGKVEREERIEKVPAAPMGLLALAWLVPGLGHLILGRRVRAAVFAGVILACWVTGLLLHGELAVPRTGSPFSYLAFLACLGQGAPYILGRLLHLGLGDPMSAGFGYGNTFLVTAGLMNLLTVLDVSDIARGMKD